MEGIKDLAAAFISVINDIFVPLIFAAAFAYFIWGVFVYLIKGAAEPGEREKGRQVIITSLIGFFLMISVWGIVRLMLGTFGFGGESRPCLPTFSGSPNCDQTSPDPEVMRARNNEQPFSRPNPQDDVPATIDVAPQNLETVPTLDTYSL